jgi:4-hydroxy-4-methyl-2-oxoglutarate aldolase
VQVEATNCTVNIGEARVDAGDILRGDADGVIVIPKAHENEVLTIAEEIDTVEGQILKAVKEGSNLAEARRRFGYHQLQTKRR